MATVPRLHWYYQGAKTSCSAWPSAYCFASRLRGMPAMFVSACSYSPRALPPPCRLGGGPGSTLFTLASPFQRSRPRARAGSPRFPDDPSRLTGNGASGAAPGQSTPKASSIPISRLPPPLHHLLPTLHDGRCRAPCKTRFRLAGCAFAGRVSNPLDRYERFQFQFITFSSPGLTLAQ